MATTLKIGVAKVLEDPDPGWFVAIGPYPTGAEAHEAMQAILLLRAHLSEIEDVGGEVDG